MNLNKLRKQLSRRILELRNHDMIGGSDSRFIVIEEQIPEYLRRLPQWVVWKLEKSARRSKPAKVPYSGKWPSKRVDVTSKSSYCSFEEACRTLTEDPTVNGVGFVVTSEDDVIGIDLDECILENGDISETALEFVGRLDGYTEVSPSGRGIRSFVRGKLPPGTKNRAGPIEVYENERFLTVTGISIHGSRIPSAQTEIELLVEKYLGSRKVPQTRLRIDSAPQMTNARVLQKARKAWNGREFSQLFNLGDTSRYESESEASMALLLMLAFWTGGHAQQMDEIFRTSKLMRPKWDERRGDSTWGMQQIEKAIQQCSEFYTAGKNSVENRPRRGRLVQLSEIETEEVKMLVEPFIPDNSMTFIQGDPSTGKSWMTGHLAARVSRGLDFFKDEPNEFGPRNVLFLNAEDDAGMTTRPRLERVGADCSKIYIEALPTLDDSNVEDWKTIQVQNLEQMKIYLEESQAKVVIIDPIQAFLTDQDMNRANDIRSVLAPFDRLARKMNVAIVAVQHFNKSTQEAALYRGLGSIDFVGIARSVIQVYKSPRDSTERGVFNIKNNLAPEGTAFTFNILSGGEFAMGEMIDMPPEKYVTSTSNGTKFDVAKEILTLELQKGAMEGSRFTALAKDNEISLSTVVRARKALKLEHVKCGDGTTIWKLPEEDESELPSPGELFHIESIEESSSSTSDEVGQHFDVSDDDVPF